MILTPFTSLLKKASRLVNEIGRQVATDKCILMLLFLIVCGVIAIIIVKIVHPENKNIRDIPGLATPALAARRFLYAVQLFGQVKLITYSVCNKIKPIPECVQAVLVLSKKCRSRRQAMSLAVTKENAVPVRTALATLSTLYRDTFGLGGES
uniref:Novel plant SNARE 13-like n=1 Tax=Tanacetum cinerariifolium TaxID=118510 RepID=A0A6L2KMX7_TANCI|nr:novel plant SNARE 13-like [Tanacetum cinerariifolium]